MVTNNGNGCIIIGDEAVKKVEDNIDLVNQAMVAELKRIIAVYRKNPDDVTLANQFFFDNCALQIAVLLNP